MKKRRTVHAALRLLSISIALFLAYSEVTATTVVLPADEDMVVGARAIIRGKVTNIGVKLDDTSGRIFTYVTVRVQEVLKGQISDREVVLKEEGGQVGNIGSSVYGAPTFDIDERVLLYLDTWSDGSLRVHQLFLGKFSIIRDERSGKQIAVRSTPDANTSIIDAASLGRPQVHSTNKMDLDSYLTLVRGMVESNRRNSRQFERRHYNQIPVVSRPPEFVSAAPGQIRPQFTLFPSTPARWFEADSGQTVPFFVNPDQMPSATTPDDLSAAMNAWSVVPGCSLRLVNGGPSGACADHFINTVTFNNCSAQFAPSPGCASVLAVTNINWDSSQRKTVNGTTFNRMIEAHVNYNPYASCDFSDPCKVREIGTHEIGHGCGLGHSQDATATMYAFIHYDGRCASLKQDDINAIVFVYPTPGPPLSISQSSLPPATVGTFYSQGVTATGGTPPYTWSVVDGLGTLPSGLVMSSDGSITGTPSASGSSSFTVKVTDSTTTSTQKALTLTVNSALAGYDAQFVSQQVPSTLTPGQVFSATVRWMNTGSQSWDPGAGFKVASQNPPNNITWGGDSVVPAQGITTSGNTLELTFQATAPHSNGVYEFQWQPWHQGSGFFGQRSSDVSIVVSDGSSPVINTPSSMDGAQGVPFSFQVPVTGGVPPYVWSIAGGALPAGVTMSAAGMISGVPGVPGPSTVDIQVTDFLSKNAHKTIAFNITPPAPVIITIGVTPGQRDVAYSFPLAADGGKPPYSWKLVAGALPAGLGITADGLLAGIPLVDGTFDFAVELTDADSRTAQKALTILIAPPPLRLGQPVSQDVARGVSFSLQLVASGGRPAYSWAVESGALPPGIGLNQSTGLLSGAPTANGTFNFTLSVSDSLGTKVTSDSVQIRVLNPDSIPSITKVKYKVGKGKLIVTGRNIDSTAVLKVDGQVVGGPPVDNQFTFKHKWPAGRHEIRIVNPSAITSQPVFLTVE